MTGRLLAIGLVLSVLIQPKILVDSHAVPKAKIVFSSTREGNSEIYVMDSDGRNQVRLTHDPAIDSDPAWSPDGTKIAFTRNKGGLQVWVMDADGGNQTRLTNVDQNFQPAWSPNGQWIAHDFWHKGAVYQIFAVRTDGSGLSKKLTRNEPHKRLPAWSPDGGTIAYVQESPFKDRTIHLMTAKGDHLKQLSEEHDGNDTDPDWFDPAGWSVSPTLNVVTTWGKIKKPTSGPR